MHLGAISFSFSLPAMGSAMCIIRGEFLNGCLWLCYKSLGSPQATFWRYPSLGACDSLYTVKVALLVTFPHFKAFLPAMGIAGCSFLKGFTPFIAPPYLGIRYALVNPAMGLIPRYTVEGLVYKQTLLGYHSPLMAFVCTLGMYPDMVPLSGVCNLCISGLYASRGYISGIYNL